MKMTPEVWSARPKKIFEGISFCNDDTRLKAVFTLAKVKCDNASNSNSNSRCL